jgi:glycerophosphoryl diester phosphodiesterase
VAREFEFQTRARFLIQFADCLARQARRELLQVYVQGLLSNVPHKNAAAIALDLIDHAKANGIRVLAWTANQTNSRKAARRQSPQVARRLQIKTATQTCALA